jgi:phenylpropionate dioxygenase-like ring-hydroxylating dioxygenase large terminal subunit
MLQGLLTPEGAIQCAYHGWKFDGDSGECLDIPQLQPGMPCGAGTALLPEPCTAPTR